MLRPIEVSQKAHHAVVACRRRLEVEAGLANQGEVAVEGAQRDAKPAPIACDGDRLAAREDRGEPDDADEAEGDAVALGVAEAPAAARWGFRRERVESGGCHSVVYSIG